MIRLFWQAIKIAPVLFAASLLSAGTASAQTITAEKEAVNETLEQINNYQDLEQGSDRSQVTNVNQLRDVSPTDWAYEALRSLVDRYGCISGFPNQTYRGSQPLTRYEFAAGLNSCLNQIERLIAAGTGNEGVTPEELETISQLTQEFEAELATIGGRVDEIESRTAVLEDNQFSTTTKLQGEAIFSVSDAFGDFADGDEDTEEDLEDETTFSARTRLNFDSSFFGEDRLRARLEAGNVTQYNEELTGTDSTRLGYDFNNDFDIVISDLHYRFPVTDRVRVWVGPRGLDLDDIFAVTNPMLESSGTGALSRFSRRNPVLFRGTEGAGAGVNLDIIEDKLAVNALYLTDDAFDAEQGEGIASGSFSAGAQLEFTPFEAVQLSASYVRNYQTDDGDINQSGSTVSGNATSPFDNTDDFPGLNTVANKIGAGVNVNLGDRFVLAGFGGYADVEGLADGENPDGEIWTWGANASVLDLVKEGSVLSIAGGMLPKFVSDRGQAEANFRVDEDPDTSYLVEALYKFPLNDNILITPGAYAVFNPNHIEDNDTIYVGVVRTTFEF